MKQFALVTGASRGIGRAVATHLSRCGYSVIVTARNQSDLQEVISELQSGDHLMIPADISSPDGVEALVASASEKSSENGLAVFVHCAAQAPDPAAEAELATTTSETLDGHLATTAASGARLLQQLKPLLAMPSRSHAILISTDWIIDGIKGPPAFAAAKAFSTAVWRHARVEYLKDGIVLSTIVAGNVASYDANWELPKWRLDDSIEEVQAELGTSRISLKDIVSIVNLIVTSPLAAITEVRVVPLDPEYVP